MAFLNLESHLKIGHPEIDRQHELQVKCVNDLHDAMVSGCGSNTLLGVLDDVINAAREHFATEEAIMSELTYSGLEDHRRIHAELLDEVQEYRERLEAGDVHAVADVLCLLERWLFDHIEREDMQLCKLIHARSDALAATD